MDSDDSPRTGALRSRVVSGGTGTLGLDRDNEDAEQAWKRTLETAIQSIVSIRFIVSRHFDTWQPGTYNATGFIVDAEQGIILTNKHVTTDAPWIGKVSFRNSEEIPAWVVWRDPIHDFGFLRFDPSSIRFMRLRAIPLNPGAARVGLAVRVPGSDAGEKLAILSGIIARLDRPAASYGVGTYNDLNTFYIQASSNTSGGSSGSPVINIHGEAVALNAGGSSSAASSFFLPLERVKIALEKLRKGEPVPRGTLQVEFVQRTYDDCRRLGMPADLEIQFRKLNPDLNGVLAVRHSVPGGPGYGLLRAGDLVIKLGGNLLNHFVDLAEVLDASVEEAKLEPGVAECLAASTKTEEGATAPRTSPGLGKPVSLTVLRNGKLVDVTVRAQDLRAITPAEYIEVGGGTVHPLSFQLARAYLHPCGGVFVADAGHMMALAGIPAFSIIVSVNHIRTPDVVSFVNVMRELPNDKRVPVRYYSLSKKNVELVKIITIEKRWGRLRLVSRDDSTGLWNFMHIQSLHNIEPLRIRSARFADFAPNRNTVSKLSHDASRSLCVVEFHAPFGIDGINTKWSEGVGIILDKELGLVVVDRSVVTTALGKVFVLFANTVLVPAVVQWIHPQQNFVFVRYDVKLTEKVPVRSVTLPDRRHGTLLANDPVYLVSVNSSTAVPRALKTNIKSRGYFLFSDTHPPKFRTLSFDEAITLHKPMNDDSGVILSEGGVAVGLWLMHPESNSYIGASLEYGGMISESLKAVQETIKRHEQSESPRLDDEETWGVPCLRVVDVELTESYFWKARELGLGEEWITRMMKARSRTARIAGRPVTASMDDVGSLEDIDAIADRDVPLEEEDEAMVDEESTDDPNNLPSGPSRYSFVTVRRVPARVVTNTNHYVGDYSETTSLREGDLILTINGRLVTRMRDLSQLISSPQDLTGVLAEGGPKSVTLHVLREGKEVDVVIPTRLLSGLPRVRVVHWAGAIFQMPHRPITFQVKQIPQGVYVSLLYSGSPAQRDALSACWFVTEVDGKPTPDLESFLEAVGYGLQGKDARVVDPVYEGWTSDIPDSVEPQSHASDDSDTDVAESDEESTMAVDAPVNEEEAARRDEIKPKLKPTAAPDPTPLEISKKATKSKSFRIRAVSLENVQKVISLDVSDASKMFWPTWKAVVDSKL
ncbi:hypothetical protein M427DRAFT_51499 [Gonapodya prolifera JEL478]|uniref:PDZ-like domain-containing protein n=1 Tax=Gonapodya prolifera (strain JEL478) TaxID=1344416 RepID=A0A139AWZ9_GONPJ|nr:hypothetical protein M427DRAFT_51499 [Gonapodya prolifera JEL478]|eukprot:KXS21250.1 hypothetical protein M427DRAFT_51499 [Gonapodya prolifera JEL478]